MALSGIVLAVLSVGLSAALSEACSCYPSHPQTEFCQADFVVKADVIARDCVDDGMFGRYNYTLDVDDIFKDLTNGTVDTDSRLLNVLTPRESATCGVNLELLTRYVIGGYEGPDGELRISLCGLHRRWDSLTDRQERMYERRYGRNCQCQVEECNDPEGCLPAQPACSWAKYNPALADCQVDLTHCRADDDVCDWDTSISYRRCQREAEATTTAAPTTEAETTEAETTEAPTTEAETTEAETTEAETTAHPATEAPTTAAPTTEAETTEAQTTETETTEAETTEAETTEAETTAQPATEAPVYDIYALLY